MEEKTIGFVGFGEVGRTFSKEISARGAKVYYYDIVNKKPEGWITFLPLDELIHTCSILLSTVVSHVAVEVAENVVQYLTPEKTFADMNSTSASVKNRIAEIIEKSNANFVEGAILSAVGQTGAKASILVSGKRAQEFARLMNHLGLTNLKYFSPKIGDASLVKMIRSVFSKGVECLLLEMLIAAKRAGVEQYLWEDIVHFMTKNSFERVAKNWIQTHPVACERRYHEMVQVLETLKEIEIEPIMTRSTKNFFQRSRALRWEHILPGKPEDFWDVPLLMETEVKKRGL